MLLVDNDATGKARGDTGKQGPRHRNSEHAAKNWTATREAKPVTTTRKAEAQRSRSHPKHQPAPEEAQTQKKESSSRKLRYIS